MKIDGSSRTINIKDVIHTKVKMRNVNIKIADHLFKWLAKKGVNKSELFREACRSIGYERQETK